jgi:hypothetical protein
MAKISNTGPKPIPENIPDTNKPVEPPQTGKLPSEPTPTRQISTDRFAASDLKAARNQMKSQLDSKLQSQPETKNDSGLSPEQLAKQAAQQQVRFAPPYVPVGPVVMGDNIPAPVSSETHEMNLRSDQFQINDQGNLVITNEKLIDYFKSLKESGKDLLLSVKPRTDE